MIITLCGSARFEPWFHIWNKALGLAGHSVFGLSSYPSQNAGKKDWYTPEDKEMLDRVHKNKISASGAVLVLNVFAYLGESTLSEIEFARENRIKIYTLESWGKGCGVDRNHSDMDRRAVRALGIEGARSPIEATQGPYLYPYDFFGPAGGRRTRLAKMVVDEEAATVAAYAQVERSQALMGKPL